MPMDILPTLLFGVWGLSIYYVLQQETKKGSSWEIGHPVKKYKQAKKISGDLFFRKIQRQLELGNKSV